MSAPTAPAQQPPIEAVREFRDEPITREMFEEERYHKNLLVPLVEQLRRAAHKNATKIGTLERQVRDLARENERLRRENNRLRSLVPQEHR